MQCTENFQCIHYDVDQEYKAHLDAYVCAQLLRRCADADAAARPDMRARSGAATI